MPPPRRLSISRLRVQRLLVEVAEYVGLVESEILQQIARSRFEAALMRQQVGDRGVFRHVGVFQGEARAVVDHRVSPGDGLPAHGNGGHRGGQGFGH